MEIVEGICDAVTEGISEGTLWGISEKKYQNCLRSFQRHCRRNSKKFPKKFIKMFPKMFSTKLSIKKIILKKFRRFRKSAPIKSQKRSFQIGFWINLLRNNKRKQEKWWKSHWRNFRNFKENYQIDSQEIAKQKSRGAADKISEPDNRKKPQWNFRSNSPGKNSNKMVNIIPKIID